MEELSKKDVLDYLWKNNLGDFHRARRDVEDLERLRDALYKAHDNAGWSRVTRTATKLLIVNSLIAIETDEGNKDLDGSLASGLHGVLHGCIAELKSLLSSAPATDESAPKRPSRRSAVAA